MNRLLINIFLTLAFVITSVACSDLQKEEVRKAKLSDSRFEPQCRLDITALKNILEERVEDQINCLEKYLILVSGIITGDQPKAIGRVELKLFLKNGIEGILEDVNPDLIRALDAVFDLNFLIGSGDKDYITEKQIRVLMKILRAFNEEIIVVYNEFKREGKVEYSWHKERRREIFEAAQRLVEPILGLFNKNRETLDQASITNILDVFSSGDEDDIIDKMKDFLVLKKIVLGGRKDVVTHEELYQLFKKAPAILAVVYDVLELSDINFKNPLEMFNFANVALENIGRDIIVKRRAGQAEIFTLREFEFYFKKLYPNRLKTDFFKAKEVVQLIKNIFFGEGKSFTGVQLRTFTSDVRDLGQKMEYFLALYEANQDELDQLSPPFVPELKYLKAKNSTEKKYRAEFKQMLGRYLYFKGDEISATFNKKTKRNAKAMLEYVVFETIGQKVFHYWEKKHPCDSSSFTKDDRCDRENYNDDLTMAQFRSLLKVAEKFLVGIGFITEGSIEGVANSIFLLSDLLLVSSKSNLQLSKHELAEFGVVGLSGISIAGVVYERLKKVCPSNNKAWIEPSCFKQNFVKELFRQGEEVEVSSYMPHFYEYAQKTSEKELLYMVEGALKYSQTCEEFANKEKVYISSGDIGLMLIGMMHIESLIVLYDQNGSNSLEPSELTKSYHERFISLINMSVESSGSIASFLIGKKSRYKIFLALVKEMKARKGLKNILWFKSIKSLESTAKRAGLNYVLGALGGGGDEDDKSQGEIDKCEALRY